MSRIVRYTIFSLALAWIALALGGCRRTKTFYQEGVSKELARYRARHIYDVKYELQFNIPGQKALPVTGNAKIHFKPLKARHGVILDFTPGEDNIQSIQVNGQETQYMIMSGHIYIDANHLVPRQNNIVDIDFTSTDQALNRSDDFMYTLFVPDRASTAFPCFDQPDLKAQFSLSLNIPGNWNALSNGKETSSQLSGGRKQIEFATDQPISTYLFAFTAGDYQVLEETRNGRTLRMLHRETDLQKMGKNAQRIFDWHFTSLAWLEEYTGIPYPYEKFDMAIIPGFQYSGMEHPGSIWYRDSRLVLDENPPLTRLISKANLIAHETAHMWFGNLVTMQWFDDVWLKEVFAGFMADKVVAELFPEANHQLQFMLSHYPRAYSIDRTQGSHPIKQELANMKMAGTLYGPIIYNKAPIIFEQLEEIMQPTNFRAAVKEYLLTYSHGNADWDDLVTIFDKHSTQNISAWSNAWVYGRGMPEVDYSVVKDNDSVFHLTIMQSSPNNQKLVFSQLLSGKAIAGNKSFTTEFFIDSHEPYTEEYPPGQNPDLVMLNARGRGYGYFRMKDQDIDFAMNNIQQIDDENLRAALALNMHENFLNGNIGTQLYFDFLPDAIWNETNQQLQSYLLSNLEQVCMNFLPYQQDPVYSEKVESVLWNSLLREEVTAKELFFDTWIKLARSKDHTDKMIQLYEGAMTLEGFTLSEQNRSQLALEIAMRHPGHEGILQKELEKLENPDRKRRFEFIIPAVSQNKEIRTAFFESLKKAENRNPEPWVLEALYFLHHPLHEGQGMEYIPESLNLLEEIQRTGDIFFPQNWLHATLRNYNDQQVAEMVKQYLEGNPELSENLRLKVYQAADIIYRSAAMRQDSL
ncbi:MAG: M1 family metallopeptidase [Bacteroidota bacterium]